MMKSVYYSVALLVGLLSGCGPDEAQDPTQTRSQIPRIVESSDTYVEKGDLDRLKDRGQLRILLPPYSDDANYLPRHGFPIHFETELLNRFASNIGLEPVWVLVDNFDALIPSLLQGKGDVVAANLTITDQRKKSIAFTVPVTIVREQLVMRAGDNIKAKKDLSGRKIAVRKSSSYWDSVQALKQDNPRLKIEVVEEKIPIETILERVANKVYDLAVADSNLVEAVRSYRDQLDVAFDISGARPIAWGVRPGSRQLKTELDRFLVKQHLTQTSNKKHTDDLAGIKKRGVLRVLTRNNAANYFLWRGELLGFEYDLVREFAKQNNLRVEMIVPPSRKDLLPWLQQGRGDLVAASLTINDAYKNSGIVFSRKTNQVSEVAVARADEPDLSNRSDLAGRTVVVRAGSAYWSTIQGLIDKGIDARLKAAPETLETEEIIARVASGDYDLTVSDSHILDIELTWRDDIKAVLKLGQPVIHGWAMRSKNKELHSVVNKFLKKEYRGLFYNMAQQKYFKKARTIKRRLMQRVDRSEGGALSPYDDLVKKYASEYDFDWRLVVAQMYQESRFDPKAKSWVGAQGLMQVMPRTAREMGISNLTAPGNGLRAGVQYLSWVRDRFDVALPVADRYWFVLAAYNAGVGHVRDARRLARQKGWASDRWFDNVERAMLLLARPQYAQRARYGYVRGSEPVKYVREIRDRYQAYVQLTAGSNN